MNILVTGTQRAETNNLAPVVQELTKRGHQVTAYATGADSEATGFEEISHVHLRPGEEIDYDQLVTGHDVVVTGMSGRDTPDAYFLRAANSAGIPTVAVLCADGNYANRIGNNPLNVGSKVAVPDENCYNTMSDELSPEIADKVIEAGEVVGIPATDVLGQMRDNYTVEQHEDTLDRLGLPAVIHLHQTINIHPDTAYFQRSKRTRENKEELFTYRMRLTHELFAAASDLSIKLVVTPHPGEETMPDFTKALASYHGFLYLPATLANHRDLILAADSITAERSIMLTEACLLDRNVGGLFPGLHESEADPYPAVGLGAIPSTFKWDGIEDILSRLVDPRFGEQLAKDREKYSVDGEASKRVADLIEGLS
jgi:hypothetical protein